MWGVGGRALSHPRPPVLRGVKPGPTTHWLWVRGVSAWGPVTNPTARSCELDLRAVGAARGFPGGGAPCLGVGHLGSGSHPRPTARPLGRAAGAQYQLAVNWGFVGVGTRQTTPQRAPQSWLCALWGRHEGAWGGRLLPGFGTTRVGRSPTPNRPSFRACGRGPVPTGCGCGGGGRGDPSPTPQRALLRAGLARCGGGTRVPEGGGASCLGVGRPGLGAPPRPDRPSFGACSWGPLPTDFGCERCGRGDPSPIPQQALLRAGLALCAGGTRAPGGGACCLGCGASGVWRSPTPDRLSFGACGQGPLPTGCGCARCARGDPSPTRQRALLRAGFARCGGGTRAPGGGASCLCVGRPGSGALPAPTARPSGRAAGAQYPPAVGAGGAGVETRHQSHSARSCELALRAVGAAQGRLGRRGLLPGCGAFGVGRSSKPYRPSFGACGRGPLPTGCGCGGFGRGDPSPTPERALLRAGFARCGGGKRAPRRGASCLCMGRPGSGALPPPTARHLGACRRGPLPTGCGCGGFGLGDPSPIPQHALL